MLVTGACAGIGRATALRGLARERPGIEVEVCGRVVAQERPALVERVPPSTVHASSAFPADGLVEGQPGDADVPPPPGISPGQVAEAVVQVGLLRLAQVPLAGDVVLGRLAVPLVRTARRTADTRGPALLHRPARS